MLSCNDKIILERCCGILKNYLVFPDCNWFKDVVFGWNYSCTFVGKCTGENICVTSGHGGLDVFQKVI